MYFGDEKSANKVVPGFFCALHRWCSDKVVVSPANIERECVAGYDSEKCFERERKRETEIFKMSRNYEEFMENLVVEMM